MKLTYLVPLAPLATGFVIPDGQIMADLQAQRGIEPISPPKDQYRILPAEVSVGDVASKIENAFDNVLETLTESKDYLNNELEAASRHVKAWMSSDNSIFSAFSPVSEPGHDHPHHPPHHRNPHENPFENLTIYEAISKSKYTTRLAKLINDDEELVDLLNNTKANFTFFAPTDKAFEKIPDHHKKPPKEFIRAVLQYHVTPAWLPARELFHTNTFPTLLKPDSLGHAQRIRTGLSLRGLTLNFYSHIVASNFFVTNGVIHAVDSLIIPPPSFLDAISFLPSAFSTLSLGLAKTGLDEALKKTAHVGATFFAPTNGAFSKLGPKANAFLFSKYGEKYLKALLQYHGVINQTLYSDAFFKSGSEESSSSGRPFHVDLPTLLDGKSLSIDIASWGPFTGIVINGFSRVAVIDGPAKDGVIQVVSNVIIPPKSPSGTGKGEPVFWQGEELTEEDLMERLEPYVEEEDRFDL